MAVSKKFYEAASKDEALRAELEQATYGALGAFLKEHGLDQEAAKAVEAAAQKVAEAHGFAPEDADELDLDELDAVAGGVCFCPAVGGGTGTGKQCACVVGGKGENDDGSLCACPIVGSGTNSGGLYN
ncbi:MAG: hypothetical protein IJ087_05570 [Eggerthellaceae bacterium]|nr:hypothetical protein [Eggerthellaceae bacterium]